MMPKVEHKCFWNVITVSWWFDSGALVVTDVLISGSVPLDPLLSASIEEGKDFAQSFPDSSTFSAISTISQTLLNSLQTDWFFSELQIFVSLYTFLLYILLLVA